jgi:hypothetical protein
MKNRLRYRPRAHALFVTAIVSVVISILCLMMVLLFYHRLRAETSYDAGVKLRRDLQSAINLVLADTVMIVRERYDSADLFGKNGDSVFIKRGYWGLCAVACITVVENGRRAGKSFFYGARQDSFSGGCLYLTDRKSPLSLSGEAKLVGDAYLSKAGIRPVFVDGKSFAYTEMLNGSVKQSLDSLPVVDRRIIGGLGGFSGKGREETGIPDTLEAPFSDTMVVLYRRGPIALSVGRLKGHILIVSDTAIRVGRNCQLQNVILAAPEIKFESGFSGTVQAVATDSIIVDNGCGFSYPSSLAVIKKEGSNGQPRVIIGDFCRVNGTIVTDAPKKDENKTYIEIGRNSTITGLVYCAGYLSLKGKVRGAVLTDYFIYRSGASIYINYLVDAEIDRRELSGFYVAPRLFANGKGNKIMQWTN